MDGKDKSDGDHDRLRLRGDGTDVGQPLFAGSDGPASSKSQQTTSSLIQNKSSSNDSDTGNDNLTISTSADWWKPWVDRIARPFPIVSTNDKQNHPASPSSSSSDSWCVPRKLLRSRPGLHSTLDSIGSQRPGERIMNYINQPNAKAGLYLVKVPKTASSTAAGVTIQIAEGYLLGGGGSADSVLKNTPGTNGGLDRNHGGNSTSSVNKKTQTQTLPPTARLECTYHVAHGAYYVSRTEPNFLWTVLRNPANRAISHYFFELVSRRGTMVTSDGMINYLEGSKNFQLDYIARMIHSGNLRYSLKPTSLTTAEDIVEIIQRDVLDVYGFIALTERMEESLVLLKMILGVSLKDVIVLSSKVRGGLDDGRFERKCVRIVESYTTPEVEKYMQQQYPLGNYDFFLHAVVNRSLDMTIDSVGRGRFDREFDLYRRAKKVAEDHCLDVAVFPCIREGDPPLPESRNSCLFGDIGCGYACVQRVLRKYDLDLL
jgi:hypothetical protein